MDGISSSLGSGSSSSDPKAAIMNQVRQVAALQNAKQLIEVGKCFLSLMYILIKSQKLNEHCFEKCVTRPGSILSSGEQTCMTQCMEKYMAAWNTVSKQYIARIQQETGRGSLF